MSFSFYVYYDVNAPKEHEVRAAALGKVCTTLAEARFERPMLI